MESSLQMPDHSPALEANPSPAVEAPVLEDNPSPAAEEHQATIGSDRNLAAAALKEPIGNAAVHLLDTNSRGVNLSPSDLIHDSEQGLISSDLQDPVEANAGLAVIPGKGNMLPVMISNLEFELLCPHQNFSMESNGE
ncbi:hypothetical protein NL676_016169 [Syzygium grande]|nr:hypothetical protein NL676_016169 [Syzygium grande]